MQAQITWPKAQTSNLISIRTQLPQEILPEATQELKINQHLKSLTSIFSLHLLASLQPWTTRTLGSLTSPRRATKNSILAPTHRRKIHTIEEMNTKEETTIHEIIVPETLILVTPLAISPTAERNMMPRSQQSVQMEQS